MQIPRPDLSINTGSPNACTQCHQEMSNNQALEHLIEWDQLRRDDQTMRTLTLAKAWSGDLSAQPDLQQIITNAKQPDLWRASALSHLALRGGGEGQDGGGTGAGGARGGDGSIKKKREGKEVLPFFSS